MHLKASDCTSIKRAYSSNKRQQGSRWQISQRTHTFLPFCNENTESIVDFRQVEERLDDARQDTAHSVSNDTSRIPRK